MAGRSPKFPHKGRQRRRRLLLGFGLMLALALGLALLTFAGGDPLGLLNAETPPVAPQQEPEDSEKSRQRNGSTRATAKNATSRGTRPAPAARQSNASAPSSQAPASPVPQSEIQESPEQAQPTTTPPAPAAGAPAPQAAPAATPQTSGTSLGLPAVPPRAPAGIFDTLPLGEISAKLTQAYKGRAPKQWGEAFAGITSRLPGGGARQVLALTLDACGGKAGSSYDAELIAFLRRSKIPATLFVTSAWIRGNPQALKELAADPLFEIAAHGLRHRPASVNGRSAYGIRGTISITELVYEVEGNARDIAEVAGKRPRWFRSGTAYYDDVAVAAIRDLGMGIAGYSIAADQGATLSASAVAARVRKAKDGDILLLHMNHPRSGTREGLQKSLPELLERGFAFVRLSDLPPGTGS